MYSSTNSCVLRWSCEVYYLGYGLTYSALPFWFNQNLALCTVCACVCFCKKKPFRSKHLRLSGRNIPEEAKKPTLTYLCKVNPKVRVEANCKKPGTLSGARYAKYQHARCLFEYLKLGPHARTSFTISRRRHSQDHS